MIEKRTVLDQVEIKPNGIVQVRFLKQLVEDGKVLSTEYHRTSIVPGVSADVMMTVINDDLRRKGYAEVTDYKQLKDHCAVAHTPEVIDKFREATEIKL